MTDHEKLDDKPTAGGDLTGCRMGDLQVLQRLGRGGMADVYKATQIALGRQVAVKVLRPDLATDAGYVERFRREARAAAKLTHPNIVQVYEVGNWEGLHFIAQEFVDGLNLREWLDREGPLSVELAVKVLLGVVSALDRAAAAGITHRDIKPENVMLSRDHEVKVADFGLARVAQPEFQSNLTQAGLTMGTPLYMSPEQVQGGPVDVRSDLYSLGVTMYHLLAGHPPFDGDTPLAIAVKQLNTTPDPVDAARSAQTGHDDLPNWLTVVIHRMMQKSPADRFQEPAEVLDYIHKAVGISEGAATLAFGSLSTQATLPATARLQQVMRAEPASPGRRRRRILAAAAVLALVLGAVGASQRPAPDVGRLMQQTSIDVPRQESVEQQYFRAQMANTPEAWESVWHYFPPEENRTNTVYAFKARLQLGRLYLSEEEYDGVHRAVEPVLTDPDAPELYKGLASALAHEAAVAQRKRDAARQHLERLRAIAGALPRSERELLEDLLPTNLLSELQTTSPPP